MFYDLDSLGRLIQSTLVASRDLIDARYYQDN